MAIVRSTQDTIFSCIKEKPRPQEEGRLTSMFSGSGHTLYPSAHIKEEPHPHLTIMASCFSNAPYPSAHIKEEPHPHLTISDAPYPSTHIKEEPHPHLTIMASCSSNATYPSTHIKQESEEDGSSNNRGAPTPTTPPPYTPAHIKEEPHPHISEPPTDTPYSGIKKEELIPFYPDSNYKQPCSEATLPNADMTPPTFPNPHASVCIKEEPKSREEILEDKSESTTGCIKEERFSCAQDDVMDMSRQCTSGEVSGHSLIGGDKVSHSIRPRPETECTIVRIKEKESGSEADDDETVPETGNYATRDHTYMVTRTEDCMRAPCNTRRLHKALSCADCGKIFFSTSAYRLHQKLHRGESIYTCSECGKNFSRKGSCEKHQEAAHCPEKSFTCQDCDRCFSSKLGLTLHQRIHLREPAFSCEECDKSFTSNSALAKHAQLHFTDKRLVCAKCGVAFHNKSDLINHEITHPMQPSFVCSECRKRFKSKADLVAHWKLHTVIKAFSWRNISIHHNPDEVEPNAAGGC